MRVDRGVVIVSGSPFAGRWPVFFFLGGGGQELFTFYQKGFHKSPFQSFLWNPCILEKRFAHVDKDKLIQSKKRMDASRTIIFIMLMHPLKTYRVSKGKDRLPSMIFQGRAVKLQHPSGDQTKEGIAKRLGTTQRYPLVSVVVRLWLNQYSFKHLNGFAHYPSDPRDWYIYLHEPGSKLLVLGMVIQPY